MTLENNFSENKDDFNPDSILSSDIDFQQYIKKFGEERTAGYLDAVRAIQAAMEKNMIKRSFYNTDGFKIINPYPINTIYKYVMKLDDDLKDVLEIGQLSLKERSPSTLLNDKCGPQIPG